MAAAASSAAFLFGLSRLLVTACTAIATAEGAFVSALGPSIFTGILVLAVGAA
jgi:hypothetical protein